MTTIHNFTENVTEIIPRNLVILGEIVVKDICANGKITIVIVINSGPTLGTEFLTSEHKTVEEAKSKEARLEFSRFLVTLIEELLIEFIVGTTEVSL